MNEKIKAHILNNHDKYGIISPFNFKPISEKEMLGLLNILEAHGENLDSFHDMAINGGNLFCGIWGAWGDDSENYSILLDFNIFYSNEDFFDVFIDEHCREAWEDDLEYNLKEYGDFATYVKEYWDSEIVKTSDGYVRILEY